MKFLFLFGFLFLLLVNGYAQQSILVQENWINSKKYYSQGVALSKSDIVNLLKDYSLLQDEYSKGNKRLNMGKWLMVAGGVVAGSGIAWIYSFPDFGLEPLFIPMALTAGLPFFLVGMEFHMIGRLKIDFAISTFNDSQLDLKRKKMELNMGFTSNGMGLILRF